MSSPLLFLFPAGGYFSPLPVLHATLREANMSVDLLFMFLRDLFNPDGFAKYFQCYCCYFAWVPHSLLGSVPGIWGQPMLAIQARCPPESAAFDGRVSSDLASVYLLRLLLPPTGR